ncbi:MAG: HAMP domain-containing sensor histidine kinase [Usitatibacter sp.]
MLHQFLSDNRAELVDRCEAKVAARTSPDKGANFVGHGVPLFLEQLISRLRDDTELDMPHDPRTDSLIAQAAVLHGKELLEHGFTVNQLVHDYGDLCQAITELASERQAPIEVEEFHTLNLCLDNAIADSVTAFSQTRDSIESDRHSAELNERLGFLAHELRNSLHTASLALSVIKQRKVGIEGATGAILDRSLVEMRSLIDRSLTDVRITAGLFPRSRLFSLSDFITEIGLSASLEAGVRGCTLSVAPVDISLAVHADRELLLSALGNLLHNAFKFTHRGSEVALTARVKGDRILLEVADHCGGLPAGDTEKMFVKFSQAGADRSGIGLGLSIARRTVELNLGTLTARDVPGTGCVFTINLPKHLLPG